MERYTYFDGGKWRLKIGDTEYSGDWVERLAAYEDTGLKPEDMKRAFNECYKDVDGLASYSTEKQFACNCVMPVKSRRYRST